jgi:hypothetical protein
MKSEIMFGITETADSVANPAELFLGSLLLLVPLKMWNVFRL